MTEKQKQKVNLYTLVLNGLDNKVIELGILWKFLKSNDSVKKINYI